MLQQVIWAALFALAVLVREGSTPHSPALRAIAAAGMLPILENVLKDYKVQSHLPVMSTVCGQWTAGKGYAAHKLPDWSCFLRALCCAHALQESSNGCMKHPLSGQAAADNCMKLNLKCRQQLSTRMRASST